MIPQIGDFIACATLAAEICHALSDSRGSKIEFTTLLTTLEALGHAMLHAETLVLSCQRAQRPGDANDKPRIAFLDLVTQGLVRERQACEDLLHKFLLRFDGYAESFVHDRRGWIRTSYKKLAWTGRKEEALMLEARIRSHLEAFQLHLHTYCYASMRFDLLDNKTLLGSVDRSVGELVTGFDNMQLLVGEALARIDVVQQSLPKSLGYCWGPDAPIRLLDGLGRRTLLPLSLASSPEIFREVLLIMHRDGPGYRKVVEGKYVVSDEENQGILISTQKWRESFQPGRYIGLSFVMRLPPGSTQEDQCPRCKTMDVRLDEHPGQRRCPKCLLTFKIDDQDRTRPFRRSRPRPRPKSRQGSPASKQRRQTEGDASTIPKKLSRTNTLPPEEYSHPYQRVHYERDAPARGVCVWTQEDPEFTNFLGALPRIHRAAATGNLRLLDELLDEEEEDGMSWRVPSDSLYRHDRTGWDFTGAPPIHLAAYYGHRDAVVHLIRCGADIDGKDSAGTTALHATCWTGNQELFRLLLKKGANPNICDFDGWTPSIYAMMQGRISFASVFAEDDPSQADILLKVYEIRHAAKQGISDSVLTMLDSFDDEGSRARLLDTALHGASEGGHNVLLQKLLHMGARAQSTDETGSTALHWAGWGGHTEIGNMHYDDEQDTEPPDDPTDNDPTADHAGTAPPSQPSLAVRLTRRSTRHESLMLLLLEYGADVNARNVAGCTPLHWVAGAGAVPMIQFFLEHGGQSDIVDRSGRSVLDRVEETGDEELMELFARLGETTSQEGRE